MAKLFSTRELFYRYPWLGKLRHRLLSFGCDFGTTFLYSGWRIIRTMHPEARQLIENGQPVIYAVYHGCMAALMHFNPRDKVTILVSNSRDGEMIAQAAEGMGFRTARGSTGRGGVRGMLEMIEAAKAGQSLAMLVDGPKGPRHVVKPGAVKLAQVTGLPIVPIGLASHEAWWMRSWDRFTTASWGSPFSLIYGEPMHVEENAGEDKLEEQCAQLDAYMRELHERAHGVWEFGTMPGIPELIA